MEEKLPESPLEGPPGDPCGDALHRIYHFLDGELTADVRARIAQHLDDCPPCGRGFEFETELRRVIASRCRETVPEELRARIARAIGHDLWE